MNLLRNVVLFGVFALLWTTACGGSSKNSGTGGTKDGGGGTGGSSQKDAGKATDAGIGPAGPGDEGAPCDPTHKCNAKLTCVASIFDMVGVCGRACTKQTDCMSSDEVCFSYSGNAVDQHCVNKVTDEYGACGVADTSVCDHRSCLYLPDLPIGVCVDTCALNTGDGEDGGTSSTTAVVPTGAVTCAAKETCIDGVLSGPLPNEGICGTVVKRGDACGIEKGIYCPAGDICAPKDPNDLKSDPQCFQDCSNQGAPCKTGKCVVVQDNGMDLFAYCM